MDFKRSTAAHDLNLNSVYVLVIENTGLLPIFAFEKGLAPKIK